MRFHQLCSRMPAIMRDVSEFLVDKRPVGTLVDLIDMVADELPSYYEAAEIRTALNLLHRCNILVGPAEYLSVAPRFRDGIDIQEAIREEIARTLAKYRLAHCLIQSRRASRRR